MNKPILILFSLLLALSIPCALTRSSKLPLLQAFATKYGTISMTNNYPGFVVNVDFTDDWAEASDSETYPTTMLLGLYTQQTMLGYYCGNDFNTYFCQDYSGCTQQSSTLSADYPNFSASGHPAYTSLYLDYDNWYTTEYSVLIASSCSSIGSSSYGANTYGILGMASSTFTKYAQLFSIYVSQDGTKGQLLNEQTSKYYTSSSVASFTTDVNLRINSFNYLEMDSNPIYNNATTDVIFDINAQYIGLPMHLYNQVINNLNTYESVSCPTTSYAGVTCTYYGTPNSLPTITIFAQNQTISIPPSVYTSGYSDGDSEVSSITLNLQALSPYLTGTNYVTPTFATTIILDYHVMSYYYTVFQVSSGSGKYITLYVADHSSDYPSPSPDPTIWIVLGSVLAFLLLALCCCGCYKASKKTRTPVIIKTQTNYQAPLLNPSSGDLSPQYEQPAYTQNAVYGANMYGQMPQQQYYYGAYPNVQGQDFQQGQGQGQEYTNANSAQYYVSQ